MVKAEVSSRRAVRLIGATLDETRSEIAIASTAAASGRLMRSCGRSTLAAECKADQRCMAQLQEVLTAATKEACRRELAAADFASGVTLTKTKAAGAPPAAQEHWRSYKPVHGEVLPAGRMLHDAEAALQASTQPAGAAIPAGYAASAKKHEVALRKLSLAPRWQRRQRCGFTSPHLDLGTDDKTEVETFVLGHTGSSLWWTWSKDDKAPANPRLRMLRLSPRHAKVWKRTVALLPSLRVWMLGPGDMLHMPKGTYHMVLTVEAKTSLVWHAL